VHNRETGNLETEKIPNFIKVAMRSSLPISQLHMNEL